MLNPNTTSAGTSPTQPASKLTTLPRHKPKPLKLRATTRAAYASDLQKFEAYGFSVPCDADTLLNFLRVQIKRVRPATALRRAMAVQHEHRRLGHTSPTADPRVRDVLRCLAAGQLPQLDDKAGKRAKAPEKVAVKSATPITRAMLLRIFDSMGTQRRAMDLRDKALMLLAFAGIKRGVIGSLDCEWLKFTADALLMTLPGEPQDRDDSTQLQRPARTLAIPRTGGPLCPVTAVEGWLAHIQQLDQTGPIFVKFDRGRDPVVGCRLDSAYINCVIKKRARDAGFTEADIGGFSAESLRRGGAMERVR